MDEHFDLKSIFVSSVKHSICILRFDLKETTFAFGHFTTIYGHFLANFIDLSQKLCADGHFEVLNKSKSQLNQKLQQKT